MKSANHEVFVTGGTGYMGRRLIEVLVSRGHTIRALTRPASAHRLPSGCEPVHGDALHGLTYAAKIAPCDTFVHLVGVSRPGPWKARDFQRIDLASVEAAVAGAVVAGIRHFVYVSVAHPAPIMLAYVAARMRAEEVIRASGIPATIVRPWYVLGPGHRWPYALVPFYWVMRRIPATRESANRLGLVTLNQMLATLVQAVEEPSDSVHVVEVPAIRRTRTMLQTGELLR
ncbi:MAG: NAD(P)H-binding protein [Gemmatimonadota bacterium]